MSLAIPLALPLAQPLAIALAKGIGNPIPALGPAAYFQYGKGITVTGAGVSQWNDQSGNGRHLLQATDAARPALQADGSILFNGTSHFLNVAFTNNQPVSIYIRGQQISWTANDYIFDGGTSSISSFQVTASPKINIRAAGIAENADWILGAYASVAWVINSASSLIQVGNGTPTTGDALANNGTKFLLGAHNVGGDGWSNIQVKEVALFNAAHDAATRAAVIAYLNTL